MNWSTLAASMPAPITISSSSPRITKQKKTPKKSFGWWNIPKIGSGWTMPALVTASTRGIGLACVKACAKEGAAVYMAARDMQQAQEIANTLTGIKCVYNDATKPETFSSVVEEVVRDAGRIDVLVNHFVTSNPGKDLDFPIQILRSFWTQ